MINRQIKNKWLNALRSGTYKVSLNGPLMRNNKNTTYNVLGVLCAVTGNTSNRDMNSRFPRINSEGDTDTFMGLSPSTQESIMHYCTSTAENANDVIRYISRNVKADS